MIVHPEELALARSYVKALPFEGVSDDQMKLIMDRGRTLHRWYKEHRGIHLAIGAAVLAFLFGADYWVLLRLPELLLRGGQEHTTWLVVGAAAVSGALHSYLLYSLGVYSMHEGAAHNLIFPPAGAVSRAANWVAANLCRFSAAVPDFYAPHHMSHHAKFGTAEDGEFLNFVLPRRYYPTLAPLATILNYSDFIIHRPSHYTWSRLVTAVCTLGYSGVYAYFMHREFGALFTVVALVVFFPHVGFYLDRMRQMTEHNLMPLENRNGSRSFGFGFWGLLLGGGPWGSPCHWEHHLVASLTWYHQLMLHVYVRSLLTPQQKKQFLLEPVIGWPKLYWHILRETARFEREAKQRLATR